MTRKLSFFIANVFIILTAYSIINFANPSKTKAQQENHPPVVKIVAPKNNSVYEWNTPLKYTITVSDPEDGDSKFDEIASTEVFLEVKYVADTLKMAADLSKAEKNEHL